MRRYIRQGAVVCSLANDDVSNVMDDEGNEHRISKSWLKSQRKRARQYKPYRLRGISQDFIESKIKPWCLQAGRDVDFYSDAWFAYKGEVCNVDLYFTCGLVVEIDGIYHDREDIMKKDFDVEFNKILQPLGLWVLRVTSDQLRTATGINNFRRDLIGLLRQFTAKGHKHRRTLAERISNHRRNLEAELGDDTPWHRDPYSDDVKKLLPEDNPFRKLYARRFHRIRIKKSAQTPYGYRIDSGTQPTRAKPKK